MNYCSILKSDIANGLGFRVSLFVAGCARHCKGCFNPASHDPNAGKLFDEAAKEKVYECLEKPWCKGLSVLGGEPLSKLSDNRKQVISFCKEVKQKFPDKDIWLWTSYYKEEIEQDESMREVLQQIDVLVDGPYEEDKRDLTIPFRGSSNQHIYNLRVNKQQHAAEDIPEEA